MSDQGQKEGGKTPADTTGGNLPKRGRGEYKQVELPSMASKVPATRLHPVPDALPKPKLVTNFVPVIPMPNREIQKYRVDFEPMVESASKLRFLFRTACQGLFLGQPIYDGVHECRSAQKLAEREVFKSVLDPKDGIEYKIKFTHTGNCMHGMEFLRNYNMHMKDFLRALGYYSPQVGLFVHPEHHTPVGQDIMLMRGFRTAAAMHEGNKVLMNLEAAHKISQRSNVLVLMTKLKDGNRGGNLNNVLNAALTGKIVVTAYNKRCYRIEEVDFTKNPSSTFDRNGREMSFSQFYQSVHNVTIQEQTQPLLRVVPNNQRRRDGEGADAKVTLLVPELCNIAGLTESQRTDGRLKMDLIRASQVPPTDRVRQMRTFLQTFHANEKIREQLQTWGYSYAKEPLEVVSHVVPPTGYAFGSTCKEERKTYPKARADTADIQVNGLAVVPPIAKIAFVTPRSQKDNKSRLLSTLKEGFDKVRLVPAGFTHQDMEGDYPNDYTKAIKNLPPDTTIAIVIMQSQNKERYDTIKKAASVEKGLITQVVTAKLLMEDKKSRSAAQKIAIQIAAKVGGEPWWVDIPLAKTMICGYDTYHDTTARGRSFGAFVASLNCRYSRWWSKSDAHDRLDEISTQMRVNIVEALRVYKSHNNNELPERIIIYRDGVGEGQLEHVFKVELEKVKEAIAEAGPIKLTMIVVNKRIGARFYMRAGSGDNFSNPPPGTVIDHTITREGRFDFYLISQSTRQGTVTPTYYNIIHDECGFTPYIHQQLAFKLCLLYYNWSGTVRVPAPCQYAHKLALLCGEHLHRQPNARMDDKLHFL